MNNSVTFTRFGEPTTRRICLGCGDGLDARRLTLYHSAECQSLARQKVRAVIRGNDIDGYTVRVYDGDALVREGRGLRTIITARTKAQQLLDEYANERRRDTDTVEVIVA